MHTAHTDNQDRIPPPALLSRTTVAPLKADDKLDYLPHLDGIRCVAIFAVLLFHFKVPYMRGGFLGVDVFFTLSGYLITRNILHPLRRDSFSIFGFYKGRFFRLFPSAVTIIFITLCTAFVVFSEDLMQELCFRAISALFSVSNMYFHSRTSYFDFSSDLKPLLHTWSLSVEEQFYLIWPLLLVLAQRLKLSSRSIVIGMTAISALSVLSALGLYARRPTFVFYELPTRFYQLSSGAVLSQLHASGSLRRKRSRSSKLLEHTWEFVTLSALLTLVTAFVVCDGRAEPPVQVLVMISTITLICSPGTFVGTALLSSPIACLVGKFSYTAYLTHWPLYVFCNFVMTGFSLGAPDLLFLIGGTFSTAWILNRTVEAPFRKPKSKLRGAFVVILASLSLLISIRGIRTGGFLSRYPPTKPRQPRLEGEFHVSSVFQHIAKLCKDENGNERPLPELDIGECRVGMTEGGRLSNYVFMGDSFARQLIPPLHEIGLIRNLSIRVFYRAGCRLQARYKPRRHISRPLRQYIQSKEQWEYLTNLPNGTTIAVSNEWQFSSRRQIVDSLQALRGDLQEVGKPMTFIGEPPGIAAEERWYFRALAIDALPFATFVKKHFLKCSPDAVLCGAKPTEMAPHHRRFELYGEYKSIFENEMNGTHFVDMITDLCPNYQHNKNVKCRSPVSEPVEASEIGYFPRGSHLTYRGSLFFVDVLLRKLFS